METIKKNNYINCLINCTITFCYIFIIYNILNTFNIYIGTDGVAEYNFSQILNNNMNYQWLSKLIIIIFVLNSVLSIKYRLLSIINYLLIYLSLLYINFSVKIIDLEFNTFINQHSNMNMFYKLIFTLIIINTLQFIFNIIPKVKYYLKSS